MWPFKAKEIKSCMICYNTEVYKTYQYGKDRYYLCFQCWFINPSPKVGKLIEAIRSK